MLEAWEEARERDSLERPLALLAAAYDLPRDQVAELPIGRRDQLLLELREWAFGTPMECESICPGCGERIEFAIDADAIRLPASSGVERATLSVDAYEIVARPLNSLDLLRSESGLDLQSARQSLLRVCIEFARREGIETDPAALPESIADAVEARLAELDPQADIQLAVSCPACGHEALTCFDIAGFLWQELCNWSRRTMEEIHSLALAYGWSEADILALPPARRAYYLERVST